MEVISYLYSEYAAKTSINMLNNQGILHWRSCAVLTHLIDQKYSIDISAGEGNYGSDGFISVANLYSKELIWLAFFKFSNPFNKISIIGEEICVTSTIGCLWKFKIKSPANCFVECF